jgi:hypothetical protein
MAPGFRCTLKRPPVNSASQVERYGSLRSCRRELTDPHALAVCPLSASRRAVFGVYAVGSTFVPHPAAHSFVGLSRRHRSCRRTACVASRVRALAQIAFDCSILPCMGCSRSRDNLRTQLAWMGGPRQLRVVSNRNLERRVMRFGLDRGCRFGLGCREDERLQRQQFLRNARGEFLPLGGACPGASVAECRRAARRSARRFRLPRRGGEGLALRLWGRAKPNRQIGMRSATFLMFETLPPFSMYRRIILAARRPGMLGVSIRRRISGT